MSIYLVTGGSGFIGSHFIETIHKRCEKIINLDINKNDLINNEIRSKKYKFINGNIRNKTLVKNLLHKYAPDFVVNFAANTHVDKSIKNPKSFIENNINGTLAILETLKECKFKKRFLQISTDEVYGDLKKKERPFKEGSKINPRNPYSISKAAADNLVNYFYKSFDLDCIITRCSNNYGERQHPEKLIPLTIMNCITKNKIPIYGNGKNIRDWIYVKDHCRVINQALKKGGSGETYLIGNSNEIKNIDLVNAIIKIFNRKNKKFNYYNLIEYVEDRKSHDKRYAVDSSKAIRDLGLKLNTNFESRLNLTVNHYLNKKDFYLKLMNNTNWFRNHYKK